MIRLVKPYYADYSLKAHVHKTATILKTVGIGSGSYGNTVPTQHNLGRTTQECQKSSSPDTGRIGVAVGSRSGKSVQCVAYIIVHEMVHLFERKHNERFGAYEALSPTQW